MPVRINDPMPEYLPATAIYRRVGVSPTTLLRLVVNKRCKFKKDPRWDYPVFCVADCLAAHGSRPRKHKPDALTHTDRGGRRPRKAAKT